MQDFVAIAEDRLREQGYRLTRPRRLVIEVLSGSDRVLSPYGLVEALAGRQEAADVVTIYRVLELLESLDLAHRVHSLHGYIACSKLSGDGCHHPLICAECGRVEEVRGDQLGHVEDRLGKTGWRVTGHVLEFTGVCPDCRAAAA